MKTTRVSLPEEILFKLAQICAEEIHAAVISMHCQLCQPPCGYHRGVQAVREIVRSISNDGYSSDRREFVRYVRYLFKELRKEKGTDARWQSYVSRVLEFHTELVTEETRKKLLSSK